MNEHGDDIHSGFSVIYPGTFDPITNGHIDLVERAISVMDKVIVAVAANVSKKPLFTVQERVELVKQSLADIPNVVVDKFDGLLAEYVRSKKTRVVIRGIRAISDFDYEFQMALTNRRLARDIETIFMLPSEEYSYLNSRLIKEISSMGGSVEDLVPQPVAEALRRKFQK